MALAKLSSAVIEGIEALPVTVEVDISQGLPGFVVVGLADKAVEESRERVRSALKHSGFKMPLAKITVHLTPSEKKKSGVHFDLPIALGLLMADGQLEKAAKLQDTLCVGGLSLDGNLQPISGTLVLVEWAKKNGFKRVALPIDNFPEAALISGIEIVPVANFRELIDWLHEEFEPSLPRTAAVQQDALDTDWLQIQGQEQAKRAVIVSAAGGHNILLEGPPGAGKTLLAKGLRALLPRLAQEELVEVVKLQSVGQQIRPGQSVESISRPFRSPHHSASQIAVIGGGTHPKPGEISLAHRGILFLDELPEFPRSVLEALRQPLEDGVVHVSRIQQTIRYPAQFTLVATMNPCPCGWLGSKQKECVCSPYQISQYRKKVSGPILDRIDLYLQIPAVTIPELQSNQRDVDGLKSARNQIEVCWQRQRRRNGGRLNSYLNSEQVSKICELDENAAELLRKAADKFVITGRSYHKLLKVGRTIADLAGSEMIAVPHIAEALRYRFGTT